MSKLIQIRCSSLPLAFRCAGSVRPASVVVNSSNRAASAGTAVHELVASLPSTNRLDWEAIPRVSSKHGADPDEVRVLCALALKLWNRVSGSFLGGMTEVELRHDLPGVSLIGHADIITVTQRSLRLADWKSGRKDSDYSQQFKGYLALALLASDADEGTVTGLWIRDADIENYTMTRRDAELWLEEFLGTVSQWDGVYRPGTHCEYCPRSHECEAHNALVRRDVAAIADKSIVVRAESELLEMTAEEIVAIVQKAAMVENYAARVRSAVRSHVEKHGDIVANGIRLTLNTETRRELDPLVAWPILEKLGFGDEDFARVLELKVSRVEDVIRERAKKGEKKRAVEQLGALLKAAGAVKVNSTKKLKEKREP